LDTLFDLRDDAVHHEEAFRPMVVYWVHAPMEIAH
jgi:hypothetical protein